MLASAYMLRDANDISKAGMPHQNEDMLQA